MIQRVKNLDRAQLGDFSALCGINWDHLAIFSCCLGWAGRSKMASHVYLPKVGMAGRLGSAELPLSPGGVRASLVSEPDTGLQTWYLRTLREQWGC